MDFFITFCDTAEGKKGMKITNSLVFMKEMWKMRKMFFGTYIYIQNCLFCQHNCLSQQADKWNFSALNFKGCSK